MSHLIELFRLCKAAKVIAPEIEYSDYVALDLSVSNRELKNHTLDTAHDYEHYIQKHLEETNSKVAFGGYLERRNLYKRSTVFKNNSTDERDIHIGLDLWINEAAPVCAVLDGTIHSFQNNTALGDYGPTIILEHELEKYKFHTLYGHLNLDSLSNLKVGDSVHKGQQIATLGLPPINGDYAPHLHFQIIINIDNKTGDYPGVCSKKDVSYYTENCPNPNFLLKIENR